MGTEPAPPAGDATKPADCDRLVAHVVALAVAERPAAAQPTEAERVQIETQLRTTWAPKCPQLSSAGLACALAAPTLTAVGDCGA